MILIPAIDLKDGKCVRLKQGEMEKVTIYSDSPSVIARKWAGLGAELLHIVDLDGAFAGELKNLKSIKEIAQSVDIPIEVGGGIRTIEAIDSLFDIGVERVILGTKAIEDPDFIRKAADKYKNKIVIGIDAKDGKVAIKGWIDVTETKAVDLAKDMAKHEIADIIYTDIKRDGMLKGPNLEAIKTMVTHTSVPIIASGGVSSLKDIKDLCKIKGLKGAIVGKALYDGALNLREALRICTTMS